VNSAGKAGITCFSPTCVFMPFSGSHQLKTLLFTLTKQHKIVVFSKHNCCRVKKQARALSFLLQIIFLDCMFITINMIISLNYSSVCVYVCVCVCGRGWGMRGRETYHESNASDSAP